LLEIYFCLEKNYPGLKAGFNPSIVVYLIAVKKIDFGRDMMALVLNRNLTKEQQLQFYVSTSYMGASNGKQVMGLATAAKTYFYKPLFELSDDEFIALVAMLKAPNYFHPEQGAKHLESRTSRIKKILAGTCKPDGWFDTEYEHCENGS